MLAAVFADLIQVQTHIRQPAVIGLACVSMVDVWALNITVKTRTYLPRSFHPSFIVLRPLFLLRPSAMLIADDLPRWFLLRSSTDREALPASMPPKIT